MPTQILMPALSPTMEEGKLAKWLVTEGSRVKPGDVIAEIETDKATMEVEAVDEGVVAELLIEAGTEKVKVNTPIAVLRGEGEAAAAAPPARPAPAPQAAAAPPSPPRAQAAPPSAAAAPSPAPSQAAAPPPPAARTNGRDAHSERIFASPLARRLAAEAGLDLAVLSGTGPHGRIIQRDIEKAKRDGVKPPSARATPGQLQSASGSAVAVQSPSAKTVAAIPDDRILALYDKDSYDVVQHDGMRRVIAERLTQSKQTVPHFYMSVDCRLDSLLAAR
jgi:pyruvate dehydrogenase E2 component (dihydrolipoamide acetyltransferase)